VIDVAVSGADYKTADELERERLDALRKLGPISDLQHRMSTRQGRRDVSRQLWSGGFYGPTFDQNAMVMARKSGSRDPLCDLFLAINKHCPHEYLEMEQERLADGK
jgi:hypothetical protein